MSPECLPDISVGVGIFVCDLDTLGRECMDTGKVRDEKIVSYALLCGLVWKRQYSVSLWLEGVEMNFTDCICTVIFECKCDCDSFTDIDFLFG